MLISAVVTTYNRPDALRAVIRGLLAQTDTNFEVIVADDGSLEATREAVAQFLPLPAGGPKRLVHAWQPDAGFRAAAVRNLGVHASAGDYLVFLDGDCIPRPDFVARHRMLAERGFMVTGSRVLLSEQFTCALLSEPRPGDVQARGFWYWLRQRLRGHASKVIPLLAFPDTRLRHYRAVKWNRIKSCNLAVWRSDYTAVNGFDESFVGWGHEDADLVLRLARHGVRRKGGAFATEVFHLWHRENARATETLNRERVEDRLESGLIRPERGLSDHPAPGDRILGWRDSLRVPAGSASLL